MSGPHAIVRSEPLLAVIQSGRYTLGPLPWRLRWRVLLGWPITIPGEVSAAVAVAPGADEVTVAMSGVEYAWPGARDCCPSTLGGRHNDLCPDVAAGLARACCASEPGTGHRPACPANPGAL